jgi:hypothetical protein
MVDREWAAWSLRAAIQTAAREGFGASIVVRPIPGLSTVHRDVEPLAGLRAAVLARKVATRQAGDYAEQARADGHSCDAVADALGLAQAEGLLTRGEQAYLHLVEHRPLHTDESDQRWGRSLVAHWRCRTCGQYVTDRGSFEAAPFNNEEGHAPEYARHAAEIAAYRAEWDKP